jgi:hypothetical protein
MRTFARGTSDPLFLPSNVAFLSRLLISRPFVLFLARCGVVIGASVAQLGFDLTGNWISLNNYLFPITSVYNAGTVGETFNPAVSDFTSYIMTGLTPSTFSLGANTFRTGAFTPVNDGVTVGTSTAPFDSCRTCNPHRNSINSRQHHRHSSDRCARTLA